MKHDWDNPVIEMKHHEPNVNEALPNDKPNIIEKTLFKKKISSFYWTSSNLLGKLSITSIGT
jgi:hypothetical protein